MIGKRKPWRSKAFMTFCHEMMRVAMCCVCGERPWSQLHHWGSDGGMGMKPNDLQVARVCFKCHDRYPFKERALVSRSAGGDDTAANLLTIFRRDSVELLSAYVQHLEGDEQYEGCSVDELTEWLATDAQGIGPDGQRDWLLAWANRRAAEIVEAYTEGVEDNGKDENRMVR